jgi:methyl-accepting chemotaxis protein
MLPPTTPVAQLNHAELLDVLTQLRTGNFSARLSPHYTGPAGEIAQALNDTLDLLSEFRTQLLRLTEELGTTGRLGGQMFMENHPGAWGTMIAALDTMAANLTLHLRLTSQTAEANATQIDDRRTTPATLPIAGELRQLAHHVNALADRAGVKAAI